FDGLERLPSKPVIDAGGVAERAIEKREHLREDPRIDARGRVIIEVDRPVGKFRRHRRGGVGHSGIYWIPEGTATGPFYQRHWTPKFTVLYSNHVRRSVRINGSGLL